MAIDQRSSAAVLSPLLTEAEVEPVMTNASDLTLACGGFLDAVNAQQISHSDQPALNEAVASAAKREPHGGGFAWDRTSGHSIAPLCAATLAHWALLAHSRPVKPPPAPPVVDSPTSRNHDDVLDRALGPGAHKNFMTTPF
jgi:hypothetical protein